VRSESIGGALLPIRVDVVGYEEDVIQSAFSLILSSFRVCIKAVPQW